MFKTKHVLTFLILFVSVSTIAHNSDGPNDVVRNFYRQYFQALSKSPAHTPNLKFSSALQSLAEADQKICDQYAKGDICGLGGNGDMYLDAQDYGDKLTLKTTKFRAVETKPGLVAVQFNILPSIKDPQARNLRKLQLRLNQENKLWVLDDIIYSWGSLKATLEKEIKDLTPAHP